MLERPSKSNTKVWKAGNEIAFQLALRQSQSPSQYIMGTGEVELSIVEASFDSGVMMTAFSSAAVSIIVLGLF